MLQGVVDNAFAELQKVNGPCDSAMRAQLTRELLAHRVMTCAALGERDPQQLKEHAVRGMTRSRRRQKHAA